MIRALRIYGLLLGASIRSEAQYRGNLIVSILGAIAHQGVGLAFLWVVVDGFGEIGGWTLSDITFLYGVRFAAHGVFTLFFNQILEGVDQVVRQGEYDRFLVRPVDPFVQLLTRRFHLSIAGDIVGGVTLLILASARANVDWSFFAVVYLVLAVLGGAMVEAAIQLFVASLSFRLLSTQAFRYALDGVFTLFGGYPLKIFPSAARFAFTFIVPIAFIAYIPSTVLLDRSGDLGVAPIIAYLAPGAGLALGVAAYAFWRRQSQHYASTGH